MDTVVDIETHSWSPAVVKPLSSQIRVRTVLDNISTTSEDVFLATQEVGEKVDGPGGKLDGVEVESSTDGLQLGICVGSDEG